MSGSSKGNLLYLKHLDCVICKPFTYYLGNQGETIDERIKLLCKINIPDFVFFQIKLLQ